MKLVLSERNKHRLTGVLVVLSLGVIFMPAVMKKSNQRFEENLTVSLKLPTKPALPKVAIPNQNAMFKSVKVAHVNLPAVPTVPATSLIAKAEPLDSKFKTQAQPKSVIASVGHRFETSASKSMNVAKAIETAQAKKITIPSVRATNVQALKKQQAFAVQLAVFTQQSNAKTLVERLHSKGFIASYNKIKGTQGDLYQVVVGQLNQREKAMDLQKKIATNMQLNGFIVKVG
ncbi:MAG: SPOR domain-containing protein [Legionellaceae bacterium]|nr:SPOR domain-containing protein [Legionellaceae bacterium]